MSEDTITITREEYAALNAVADCWERNVSDVQAVYRNMDMDESSWGHEKLGAAIDAMGNAVLATAKFVKKKTSRRSVQRMIRCAFTASEACHILSLIVCNERSGEHTAPRDQYWERSERIKAKLASKPNENGHR